MQLGTSPLVAAFCLAGLTAQDPYITEVMARNATTLRDDRGRMSDWIEIYNPRSSSIDMTGWYLTDDQLNLKKFKFDVRIVPAGGYLLVYASGLNRRFTGYPMHTNFTLNGDLGEYLALVKPGGTIIASQMPFVKQRVDVSFGLAVGTNTRLFFDTPTPGARNGAGFVGLANKVTPSVLRGFYDSAFSVTLSSLSFGTTFRYTTNGSRPTRSKGTIYSGPIAINGTTTLRMVAYSSTLAVSRVDTHSYIFLADVLKQNNTPTGYPSTWGTHWTGSTNFVAKADYAMDQKIVGSAKYAPQMLDSLKSVPTISVVLDIADLFDKNTGIYSNPLNSGRRWERASSVEVFYPRMGRHVQGNGGVRILGRGSRRPWLTPKHSFRLLFKEGYGPNDLNVDLFGGGAASKFDTIALRSVFNDSFTATVPQGATYLRDMLIHDASSAGGRIQTHAAVAHVYINGLYWGLYTPSERPDADFQAHYFGGTDDDYDVLKHFNGDVVAGDRIAFDKALFIASLGLSTPAAYASIRQYIDVESLADYMALNFWAGSTDWPINNWYMARRRVPGGTFKFFNWDSEKCLNDVNVNRTNVKDVKSPGYFYDKLRRNAEFRVLFGDRAHRLLYNDGPLIPSRATALFNRRAQETRAAIIAETARWGDVRKVPAYDRDQNWDPSVAWVNQTFFPQRHAKFVAQLRAALLYPTVVAPTFNKHGGEINPGFKLSISVPRGTIYFTLDGSDPRLVGGAVSTTAQSYTAAITLNQSTTVKSRVLDTGSWSALNEARFSISALVVNEIMARNTIGIRDNAGQREDWIELINKSNVAVAAGGMYLTDDLAYPKMWQLPAGVVVQPGGTLLIWADNQVTQGPFHANFKLGIKGESIFLFDKDGSTKLSGFHFGPQIADISLGRLYDGTGPLVTFPEPTPSRSNMAPCRRIFSGRNQDLHPISYDVSAPPRIGSLVWLLSKGSTPNEWVVILWSRSAGYFAPLSPANELALLVGPPLMPRVMVRADAQGNTAVPIGLANDPNLIGFRVYFQMFSFQSGGIRGSNAVELTICR